jgi:tetratricopeptide (TPR) repeat protein
MKWAVLGNTDMPVTEKNELRRAGAEPENSGSTHAHGMAYWVPRVLTAVLIPIVLIGLLEGALRLFDVGFPTDATVPCTLKGQSASCYNLFFPAPFFPPGMIKTPQAYAIPVSKPPGTYRIFVLGESAAMGDPDPAYAFSRYLEVMLRKNYPQMNFEVINTGSVAVNSHVLLPLVRGLAKQRPDLFIIYSGNNEVVGPYGPGTALTSSGMNLSVIRASIFARSSRVGQLLIKLGTQKKEWRGMEMFLDRQVAASSPLMKYAYSNFEANLRETVEIARASGARVIVSTVAMNLKDCAPFASMHREGLSQDDLRSWSALVQQGTELENARAYADAMKIYTAALKIDDQYAELEFRMARTSWMSGDYASAREHFQRARDLDTLRFRADSKINGINRSVASSRGGAELVDAEAAFAEQSPNGVVGSDLVYEHVHLTPLGNYLLARAMFLQIASKMAGGHAVAEDDIPSEANCERLLALTPHDRIRIAGEMFQRLQKPPFTNQSNHSDQMLRLAMQAEVPDENPNQTALEYQWAVSQRPDDRVLHYNYGLFLFGYDRNSSFAELKMAQPWDGFPVFAPDGTPVQ